MLDFITMSRIYYRKNALPSSRTSDTVFMFVRRRARFSVDDLLIVLPAVSGMANEHGAAKSCTHITPDRQTRRAEGIRTSHEFSQALRQGGWKGPTPGKATENKPAHA